MAGRPLRGSPTHRVVVGVDAVLSQRTADPSVAIVALVDETSPTESVLAQLAGADAVLAVPSPDDGQGSDQDQPGLALAIRVAEVVALRRNTTVAASRQGCHDVADGLNVIGLVAEAGQQGRVEQDEAFQQIQSLVRNAGDDSWRVGRAYRSSSYVLRCLDLGQFFDDMTFPAGIELVIQEPPEPLTTKDVVIVADSRWLCEALDELIDNAKQAAATNICIEVTTDGETVNITVSDDGVGFRNYCDTLERPFAADAKSNRLGLGLATIAEHATELGGVLTVADPGGKQQLTQVRLSLPRLDVESLAPKARTSLPIDPAAAQASILEGVVRHVPLSQSLEGIVTAIEHQLPGTVCSVLLLNDGHWLRHGAGVRLPLAYREAIDGVEVGLGQGSCGTAAYTGRPVIASDVTTDPNWIDFRSIATEHGLRSCWSTPIVAAEGGETLGTFAVYTKTVWSPDRAAIRLVNRLTYLAAVAIEHHRLFKALAESETRFRSAFEGAAAGIALAGLDGVILKSNSALSGVVGHEADRLTGISLLDLIDPTYRNTVADSWAQLTTVEPSGQQNPVEVPLATTSGVQQQWLSIHTSLIPGQSSHQPYLYVEVRDITAARQHHADLRAREAAEAANQAKTDFLALASHELRTPLNSILGFAQVMQLVDLDDTQRTESIGHIVNAGRHLRDLIDQLLDLSRIESGHLSVAAHPLDASAVVGEALELLSPLAAARDVELVDSISGNQSLGVFADHHCLRQVLINLLENAIKYTPGTGRVELKLDRLDESVVRISVLDSGQGISPDSLDAIFEPFHRLDKSSDSESEGAGLGLALCARLMREMDGSIGVTSTVGVGSTFWIELPAAGLAPEQRSGGATASPTTVSGKPRSAPGKVLYIEDDQASIDVIGAAMELRPNLDLRAVHTAREGAAEIAGNTPDLVLLDVGLPDRSGWELLEEIRSSHPSLPVMILTAGSDIIAHNPTLNGSANAEAGSGCTVQPDHLFTKPIDVSDVLLAIDLAFTRSSGRDLLAQTMDERN